MRLKIFRILFIILCMIAFTWANSFGDGDGNDIPHQTHMTHERCPSITDCTDCHDGPLIYPVPNPLSGQFMRLKLKWDKSYYGIVKNDILSHFETLRAFPNFLTEPSSLYITSYIPGNFLKHDVA